MVYGSHATDSFPSSARVKMAFREWRDEGNAHAGQGGRLIALYTPFCNRVTPSTSRDTGNYWKIARRPVPAFSIIAPTKRPRPIFLVIRYRARKRPTPFRKSRHYSSDPPSWSSSMSHGGRGVKRCTGKVNRSFEILLWNDRSFPFLSLFLLFLFQCGSFDADVYSKLHVLV